VTDSGPCWTLWPCCLTKRQRIFHCLRPYSMPYQQVLPCCCSFRYNAAAIPGINSTWVTERRHASALLLSAQLLGLPHPFPLQELQLAKLWQFMPAWVDSQLNRFLCSPPPLRLRYIYRTDNKTRSSQLQTYKSQLQTYKSHARCFAATGPASHPATAP